jgi:hypothetical protein
MNSCFCFDRKENSSGRSREKDRDLPKRQKPDITSQQTDDSSFMLDNSRDKNLWIYGSLPKGKISEFRLLSDCPLGERKARSQKRSEQAPRYFGKAERKVLKSRGSATAGQYMEQRPLQYISIDDSSKPVDDDKTENQSRDEALQKNAFYNKSLQKDPRNVTLWLEFISIQDRLFHDLQGSGPGLAQACLEKKTAIVTQALEANPDSLQLQLCKVQLLKEAGDFMAVDAAWKELVQTQTSNVTLWQHYLKFQMTELSTFSVERVVETFHQCFRTLNSVLGDSEKDGADEELIGM